jgi:hypothetical protein
MTETVLDVFLVLLKVSILIHQNNAYDVTLLIKIITLCIA